LRNENERWEKTRDVLIMLLLYFGVSFTVGLLVTAALGKNDNAYQLTAVGIAAAIDLPVFGALYKKNTTRERREKKRPKALFYIMIPFLAAALCVLLNVLLEISGAARLSPGYEEAATSLLSGNPVWSVLIVGFLTPAAEEMVFRGAVFGRLRAGERYVTGVVISALLFGLAHGNFIQFLYAFFAGLVFAYLTDRFQSIAAPVIAHATMNLVSIALTKTRVLEMIYASWPRILLTIILSGAVFGLLFWRIAKEKALFRDIL